MRRCRAYLWEKIDVHDEYYINSHSTRNRNRCDDNTQLKNVYTLDWGRFPPSWSDFECIKGRRNNDEGMSE